MAKITLTEEEEIMYLRELDKLQDMMPDLEIQILAHPLPYDGRSFHAESSNAGSEFRAFLQNAQAAAKPIPAPAKG